jgi:nicotinamidase-related amidase
MAALTLVLVDLQTGFLHPRWGARNNPALERNVAALLAAFRRSGHAVFHVRHDSLEPRSTLKRGRLGFAFLPEAAPLPGERVFTKQRHAAFVGTRLASALRGKGRPVFAGLTADHCVSTSVRLAHDLGFRPLVAVDAVATFPRRAPCGKILPADLVQDAALGSLAGEFAELFTTKQLMRMLR